MDPFLTGLIVTHAYSFASSGSTISRKTTSALLECSPTTAAMGDPQLRHQTYARKFSTPGRSTSELLRTL